jgi:16S rRNA (cytidine1402-2'-O)-methyltransferase
MNMTKSETGRLYIVATPIGNRDDITYRAVKVLSQVDLILAEDTRHSRPLLDYYDISTRLKSCHEHNESSIVTMVLELLAQGKSLALISDAGTPLISDPGFVLVRAVRQAGYEVVTVPGPSSIIAALSIAGLPTDRFVYEGFMPAKSAARRERYRDLLSDSRTIVALESSHRIAASLNDLQEVAGRERQIAVARELTKRFETVLFGSVSQVVSQLQQDSNQLKGEFVVLISGSTEAAVTSNGLSSKRVLEILSAELGLKQAAKLAAELTGEKKNDLYTLGLTLKQ